MRTQVKRKQVNGLTHWQSDVYFSRCFLFLLFRVTVSSALLVSKQVLITISRISTSSQNSLGARAPIYVRGWLWPLVFWHWFTEVHDPPESFRQSQVISFHPRRDPGGVRCVEAWEKHLNPDGICSEKRSGSYWLYESRDVYLLWMME